MAVRLEPKAFSTHWYRCLRALGIRVRGLYATKDTFISLALSAGVKIPWLEAQTGVRYETLRRHYGKWLRSGGGDQLEKLARLAPSLAPKNRRRAQVSDFTELEKCEEGDLNPTTPAEFLQIPHPRTAKDRHRPPRIVSGGHNRDAGRRRASDER